MYMGENLPSWHLVLPWLAVHAARSAAVRLMQGSLSCGDCRVYQDLFVNKLETEQYLLKKLAKNKREHV